MQEIQNLQRNTGPYTGAVYSLQNSSESEDMIKSETLSRKFSTKKKISTIEEGLIPTPTGNLKPHLVVVNQGRVRAVDVTVRHEDTAYLDKGYRSIVQKYTPLL